MHGTNMEIFPFCGRTGSIYRVWLMRLQRTADSVWGNEKRHRWEATTSNSARTPLQFPPLRASPSTPTGHYRLWQGIPEPNLELNRLLNTRTLLIQRENEQKAPALHFSPAPFLLPWDCSCESVFFFRAGAACITEDFLEALTEWKGLH